MEVYPLASFTLGINIAQFQGEVLSVLPLLYINSDTVNISMFFSLPLNPAQQATLASLVVAHNPVPKVGYNAPVLNNTEATGEPTINDDSTKGYTKMSSWIYQQREWTCTNATYPAIWILRTPTHMLPYKIKVDLTSFTEITTSYNQTSTLTLTLYANIVDRDFTITDGINNIIINASGLQTYTLTSLVGLISISVKKNISGGTSPTINFLTLS